MLSQRKQSDVVIRLHVAALHFVVAFEVVTRFALHTVESHLHTSTHRSICFLSSARVNMIGLDVANNVRRLETRIQVSSRVVEESLAALRLMERERNLQVRQFD